MFCGGGTGGHVFPAIAMADALRLADPDAKVLFLGVEDRAEAEIVPSRGYELRFIKAHPFPASVGIDFAGFIFRLLCGVAKSAVELLRFRPNVLISTGGYVSVPVFIAYHLLKKAGFLKRSVSFLHEQNAHPGRAALLISRWADCVGVSFPESSRFFPPDKVSLTGYPVRSEIKKGDRLSARRSLGINDGDFVILVVGGSQGARSINNALAPILPQLLEDETVVVIHSTGKGASQNAGIRLRDGHRYRPIEFIKDMATYYNAADLVISRAGSGSIHEIMTCGLPSIIIPKTGLPGDHQIKNARVFEKAGACLVLYERFRYNGEKFGESYVDERELLSAIRRFISRKDELKEMAEKASELAPTDSLERIVSQIGALLSGDGVIYPPGDERIDSDISSLSAARVADLLKDGEIELTPEDKRYLWCIAERFLSAEKWQVRNVGVKLVGFSGHIRVLPRFLDMMRSRRPAPLWQRMLGGDYREVGFIRRNIVEAVKNLGVWNDYAREILLEGLADPYYEARARAASAVADLSFLMEDRDRELMEEALLKNLDDDDFEVLMETIIALSKISRNVDLVRKFRRFYYHSSWKVRDAIVRAFINLIDRGVADPALIRRELEELLLTCDFFSPSFPLKNDLQKLIERLKEEARPLAGPRSVRS